MNDAAPRMVLPLVELDYRVLLGAYLIVAVALAASFYETGASPVAWVAMLVQCLAWPHVARAVARASRDSKRSELANLLVDAAIIGAWIAVISFDPWLTTTYVISLTVAFLLGIGIAQGYATIGAIGF